MGAARDPQEPIGGGAGHASRGTTLEDVRRQLEIELDVAHHMGLRGVGADGPEALSIVLTLCRDDDAVRERLVEKTGQQPVTPHGAWRDAGARQHQGNTAPAAGTEQVRPEFGLEDHRDAGPDAVEEPPDAARQVVGQVAQIDGVTERGTRARLAGRRDGGEHERHTRVAPLQ